MRIAEVTVVGAAGAPNYIQHLTSGGHTLLADEPTERAGGDAGPAPFDYLLAALGSCTSITMRMYADRKGFDLGNVSIKLEYIRESKEVARITRAVSVSAKITEEQRARLADIIERTPVTLVVKQGVGIASSVSVG